MSADIEETVMNADFGNLQHAFPDLHQKLLFRACRRMEFPASFSCTPVPLTPFHGVSGSHWYQIRRARHARHRIVKDWSFGTGPHTCEQRVIVLEHPGYALLLEQSGVVFNLCPPL